MIVRRFNVLSVAKVTGILGLGMGLIGAVLYGGMLFLVTAVGRGAGGPAPLGNAALFVIPFLIFMPVLYGGMMFVSGLIGGLIYNLAAGWTGGIEIEVDMESAEYE
jgi:hypothetical protein